MHFLRPEPGKSLYSFESPTTTLVPTDIGKSRCPSHLLKDITFSWFQSSRYVIPMVHVTIENPEVHPVEEPEVQDPQGLHYPAHSPRSRTDDLHDSRNTQ